jgi:hypothetical protein
MKNCPHCNEPMEKADYLETEDDFVSDYICMNEDCKQSKESQ